MERLAIPQPSTVEGLGPWRWARLGLGLVWLAGTLVLLVQLLIGRCILGRLRSSARSVTGTSLARYQSELGSRRGVTLATHPAVGSPVVLGGLAPTILVPDDWDDWPDATQRACLLHELAHLERRDDLTKLGAELTRALFWFHPAVVWLLARLDREAELACDDVAVSLGIVPLDLARLLFTFASRPLRLDLRRLVIGRQALSFFDRDTVSHRITRLMEDEMTRVSIPPSKSSSFGQVAIVAALALAIGGARVRALEPHAPKQAAQPRQAPAQVKSFSVVVKDEEGRPIEGATVVAGTVEDKAARPVTVARTDVDGSVRFNRESKPEVVWILAHKEGYSFRCSNPWDPTGWNTPIPLTLGRPRSLSGTVVDEKGHPIEGAEVWVELARASNIPVIADIPNPELLVRGTPIERVLRASSDHQGNFRFESLNEGEIFLRASAEGRAVIVETSRTTSRRTSNGTDAPTRIVLPPEARVVGRVVSTIPGVRMAGHSVRLFGVLDRTSHHLSGKATTDGEGRFEIRGLAKGQANLFLNDVPADGPWTFLAATEITLASGTTTEARIELTEGVMVSGSVTSTDRKPILGVPIHVYGARNPRSGSPPVTAATDVNGVYRFRMPPGNVFVFLADKVAGYTSLGEDESRRSAIIPSTSATFTLPPFLMAPGVKLFGRILDAVGKPLEGAQLIGVSIQNSRRPFHQLSATADAKGEFRLDTQADGQPIPLDQSVKFRVRLADGKEFDASVVPTGQDAVTIKLPTLRDDAPKGPEQVAPDELAGVVVDLQGRPIEGVLAHPYSWIPNYKAFTDKDGRFRIKVPEQGNLEIRFTKEGYEPREFLKQPTGQTGWVVVMGNRTYFEGRVLTPDGKPVPDAPIRADSGPKWLEGGMMNNCWTEGRSGKDGRYRLYVEPGMYDFQVRVPDIGVARLPKQSIASDEVRVLDIPLAQGVDFEAHVVDAQDGTPVTGFVLKDWMNPSVGGTSDANGILRIPAMVPGRCNFDLIEAEGYARWWSDACVSKWGRFEKTDHLRFQRNFDDLDFDMKSGMVPVTIFVEKSATIRGRVLDPDGKPVAGATVAPAQSGTGNSLTGDTRFSVETDQDGAFTMRLPASGEFAYNLVAHDGKYEQWRTWANGIIAPFRTRPGQVMDNVTLSLTRPATIRGRVIDAAGQPIVGREIHAIAADKRENRYYEPTTKTGPDGTFELRFLRAGEQYIQVAPYWQTSTGASRTLTLAEGETKAGIELRLGPDR